MPILSTYPNRVLTKLAGVDASGNVGLTGSGIKLNTGAFNPSSNADGQIVLSGNYGGGLVFNDTGFGGVWMISTGTTMSFGVGGTSGGIPTTMTLTSASLIHSGGALIGVNCIATDSVNYKLMLAGDASNCYIEAGNAAFSAVKDLYITGYYTNRLALIVLDSDQVFTGSSISMGRGVSTGDSYIELGTFRTGNGNAYIDFHSTSGSDYEFRILRTGGTNGLLQLSHKGSGDLQITQEDTGTIKFGLGGASYVQIEPGSPARLVPTANYNMQLGDSTRGWVSLSIAGSDSGIDLSNGCTMTRRGSDGHVRFTSQNDVYTFDDAGANVILSGGEGAAAGLTLQSTTAAGSGDYINFKTGSQVERFRIDTNGRGTYGLAFSALSSAAQSWLNGGFGPANGPQSKLQVIDINPVLNWDSGTVGGIVEYTASNVGSNLTAAGVYGVGFGSFAGGVTGHMVRGGDFDALMYGAGTCDLLYGAVNYAQQSAGVVGTMAALRCTSYQEAGTVTNFYGIFLDSLYSGATISGEAVGLKISDITPTTAFAIKTGANPVQFGGKLILAPGTTAVQPLLYSTGSVLLTTPVAGSWEFDDKVFYATALASSRQVIDCEQVQVLSGTRTLTNNTSAQAIFNASANGALTVAGSTTYEFECAVSIASLSASAHTISFGFGGAATFTACHYFFTGAAAAAVGTPTAALTGWIAVATASLVVASSSLAGATFYLRGIMRINGAGTIIPQVTQVTNSAAAVVQIDSFFRCWPIGSNTVTNVGNWS